MKMERLSLILVLALSGCSALVSSALEEEEVSSDCRRMPDGTRCGEDQVCINNLCETARCGDGVVSRGEECDELDDVSGDGCEPITCQFSCTTAEDCPSSDCATASCDDNACTLTATDDGTSCSPPTGDDGTCQMGECISSNCGNGIVDEGEECEPEMFEGCVACQYECESNEDCDDLQPCNGVETCNMAEFACVAGEALDCNDGDECTDDACSDLSGMCLNVLIDPDMDGYADAALTCSDEALGGDCAPTDPDINPGAAEVCDMIDNNCRDGADENDMIQCFPDADGDLFGGGDGVARTCECLDGEVTRGGDCFDDARFGRSISPSQRGYFARPYCTTGRTCFDYNCDGANTVEDVRRGSCSGRIGACRYIAGWQGAVPGCGEEAEFITSCDLFCTAETETRAQRCH